MTKTIKQILDLVHECGRQEFIVSPKRPTMEVDQALAEIKRIVDEEVIGMRNGNGNWYASSGSLTRDEWYSQEELKEEQRANLLKVLE